MCRGLAAVGVWKDTSTLLTCCEQPGAVTIIGVMSEPRPTVHNVASLPEARRLWLYARPLEFAIEDPTLFFMLAWEEFQELGHARITVAGWISLVAMETRRA
jgi:hypothetical protein